jgi:methionyl-tRNA formyltransferase
MMGGQHETMKYILGGKFSAAIVAAKKLQSLGINFYICPSSGEKVIPELPSLEQYAIDQGIETIKNLNEMKGEKIFFLSVEFDRLVNRSNFSPDSNFFNVHFSLLPLFRGTMTSFWPIIFRKKETGVTIHEIDDGIDTGDIIFQKKFNLLPSYTCRDLYFKYHEIASLLIDETLEMLIHNKYIKHSQNDEISTSFPRFLFNYFPKYFTSTQFCLMETEDVYNVIRSLIFPEFQLPTLDGKQITKISKTPFPEQNVVIKSNKGKLYAKSI